MTREWERVDTITGYERTYRSRSSRVAFRPMTRGAKFLHCDLFVDESEDSTPLPPVFVEGMEQLTDAFYENCMRSVCWHITDNE